MQYNDMKMRKYLDEVMPVLIDIYGTVDGHIMISDATRLNGLSYYGVPFDWVFLSRWMKSHHWRAYKYLSKYYVEMKDYLFKYYELDGYKKLCICNARNWKQLIEVLHLKDVPDNTQYAKGIIYIKDKK